jgi:hypothetical protein
VEPDRWSKSEPQRNATIRQGGNATMVDQSAVAVSSSDPSNAPPSAPVSPNDVVDVTVHPLVLLSAADHYHRVARGTRKRAVGVLLGTVSRGRVDASNSFAVPFEEDSKNPVSFVASHVGEWLVWPVLSRI